MLSADCPRNTAAADSREAFLRLKLAQLEQELECANRTLMELKRYINQGETQND